MRKSLTLGLVLGLFVLSGCAEKWAKTGATEQDFEATKAACFSRASYRFPPLIRLVPVSNAYTTPVTTNCNSDRHSTSCTTSGGQFVPPTMAEVDDNQSARDQDMRACLFEKGWHIVKDDERQQE